MSVTLQERHQIIYAIDAHRHVLSADNILVWYQVHAVPCSSHHRAVGNAVERAALIQGHLLGTIKQGCIQPIAKLGTGPGRGKMLKCCVILPRGTERGDLDREWIKLTDNAFHQTLLR